MSDEPRSSARSAFATFRNAFFSGVLLLAPLVVPRTEVVELGTSKGDGMKMIISGGAGLPPWPAAATPPESVP